MPNLTINYKNSTREVWVDLIKVLASFAVIWLHVAATLVSKYNQIPLANWWVANVADSLVRMCVPLFFMISGYLLLSRPLSLKIHIRKRIGRIIIPWVFWAVVYFLFRIYYQDENLTFLSCIRLFINGDVYYHFWFLYALMGLYLFIPILTAILTTNYQNYFIVLWFLTVGIFPFLIVMASFIGRNMNVGLDLRMFAGYSGYLLIGYLLGKIELPKKIQLFSLLIFAIAVVLTAWGTYFAHSQASVFAYYFYEYLSPNVILMSISSFIAIKLFAKHIRPHSLTYRVIFNLSLASFGIYLVHPIILRLLEDGLFGFSLSTETFQPAFSIPILAFVTFLLSFICIAIISRIPWFRRVIL